MDQRLWVCLLLGALLGCLPNRAPIPLTVHEPLPGQGLADGMFALSEMDLHVHSGMERPLPLEEWVDLAVAGGRKVLLVLDHRELYDQNQKELDAWIAENRIPQWYAPGIQGQKTLMRELDALNQRKDVLAFRGWEIWEGELDEGLDREAMALAEVIGWHISSNGDPAPCGKMLIRRLRQILEVQKEFPVPMIVFHPFPAHIERVRSIVKGKGKASSELTAQDYRFFQPGEAEEVCCLLKGKSVYIEISRGQEKLWEDPVIRQALIEDIKPLAEAGVQFTVSTDAHGAEDLKRPFDPETYCAGLGVSPQNTNTIVRELLAIRVRRRPASRILQ